MKTRHLAEAVLVAVGVAAFPAEASAQLLGIGLKLSRVRPDDPSRRRRGCSAGPLRIISSSRGADVPGLDRLKLSHRGLMWNGGLAFYF